MAHSVLGEPNPPSCSFSSAGIGLGAFCDEQATIGINGKQVVVGQTIYYQANVFQAGSFNCGFQGGQIVITTPDGAPHDVTPGGGVPLVCGDATCDPAGVPAVFSQVISYQVRAEDIGDNQEGFVACPANSLQATVRYTGGTSFCDTGNTCDPSAATSVCNPGRTIAFEVEESIVCTTGTECGPSADYSDSASGAQFGATDPKFCFRVIYRNLGTANLAITSAVNTVGVTLTAPGGMIAGSVVTNYFGPVTRNTSVTDTVTALGYAQTDQNAQCLRVPVNDTDSATATVVPSDISCQVLFVRGGQALTSNTTCDPLTGCTASDVQVIPGGGDVTVVVRVTNNGEQNVSGKVTVNAQEFNFGSITPGNSADVNTVTQDGNTIGCHSFSADVLASGALTGDCPPPTTSCTGQFQICGEPKVCIIKLVKCLDVEECVGGACGQDMSLYAPSATGAKNAAFCYVVAIENCGTLTLTNVVVNDTQLGDGLAGFPTELAPGQAVTNFYQKVYADYVGEKANVAEVLGESVAGNVSASSNAVVTILSPSIVCEKTVAIDGGEPTAGGTIQIPFGTTKDLTFAVRVTNNGTVDLENVQITDTGTSGCDPAVIVVENLAVGVTTNITLCTVVGVPCPPVTTLTNIVSVSAEIAGEVCSIDPFECIEIGASSSCTNVITLTCTPPGACRTTGGGKQIANNLEGELKQWTCQSAAVDTPSPRYVTHGGQVGAPFAVGTTCITNTPCIRGEWQHVRHIKGGLRGVFHASSNGNVHEFDSLRCACLPCPEFADVVASPSPGLCSSESTPVSLDYTSQLALVAGKRDEVCNPNDRTCGPEPRHAPANKIAFSGVGNYALTKGKKEPQSVVFRVDIEDRSEPGGSHPGGQTPPPDRYRIRIWFLKGNEGGATGSATTTDALKLRCAVAVKDPLKETVEACRAPDIDDGGALDRGNRQIHPITGATPPADCGTEIDPGPCGD